MITLTVFQFILSHLVAAQIFGLPDPDTKEEQEEDSDRGVKMLERLFYKNQPWKVSLICIDMCSLQLIFNRWSISREYSLVR